jgi:pyruvate,water dikinase
VPLQGAAPASRDAADLRTTLSDDDDLQRLREMGRRIERHFGRPQDIEWAIDQQGQLLILQSRPETVWSAREAAPVAAAKDNPLHHLMDVFGGKR